MNELLVEYRDKDGEKHLIRLHTNLNEKDLIGIEAQVNKSRIEHSPIKIHKVIKVEDETE